MMGLADITLDRLRKEWGAYLAFFKEGNKTCNVAVHICFWIVYSVSDTSLH